MNIFLEGVAATLIVVASIAAVIAPWVLAVWLFYWAADSWVGFGSKAARRVRALKYLLAFTYLLALICASGGFIFWMENQ